MSLKTCNDDRSVGPSRWIIAVALTSAALMGCATHKPSGTVSGMEPGQGLVIGSVTFGETASEYRIYYQKKNTSSNIFGRASQGGYIEIDSNDSDNGRTELFAINLPEGDYEFSSWRIVSGKKQIVPKDKFSITFDSTPRKATYVGNFDFRNTLSNGSPSSNLVTFSNNYDRDVKLLNTQYENLDFSAITPGIDPDFSLLWTQAQSATRRSLLFVVFSTF